MINKQSYKILISILLIFSLTTLPVVHASQKISLFQKIKNKIHQKSNQLKDKNWWKEKSIASSIGFVASKLGGVAGAAIGYLAGAAVGGPLAAGGGAVLGYRIGCSLTRVFGKAIGVIIAKVKIRDKKKITFQTVKDAIKSLNKKKLSAEGTGAVIGDLVGGTFGAAFGIALLAGSGPLAIPIIGTVSAAYIGSKLGTAAGRGLGRFLGKKILKHGYQTVASAVVETPDNKTIHSKTEKIRDTNLTSHSSNTIASKKQAYESAYKEYIRVSTKKNATATEINNAIANYRNSYNVYTSLIRSSNQN